jgi:hypothetical protein
VNHKSRSDDESVSASLEHFAERLNLVFSYFFCALEFSEDEDISGEPGKNDRTWALQTIRNACLLATLIALRDLDDFLTPRTKDSKPDDLKASDIGFPNSCGFLAKSERRSINKIMAHSTLPGVAARGIRWDVFELATKGIRQSMQFLEWVEKHFGCKHILTWSAALVCRSKTQAIYDYIAKAVERERAKRNETGNA